MLAYWLFSSICNAQSEIMSKNGQYDFNGSVDETSGLFAYSLVDGKLNAPAAPVTTTGCALAGGDGFVAKGSIAVVYMDNANACNTALPGLFRSLQERGAAGIVYAGDYCLCSENDKDVCGKRECLLDGVLETSVFGYIEDLVIPVVKVKRTTAKNLSLSQNIELTISQQFKAKVSLDLELFTTYGDNSPFKSTVFSSKILPAFQDKFEIFRVQTYVFNELVVDCNAGNNCETCIDSGACKNVSTESQMPSVVIDCKSAAKDKFAEDQCTHFCDSTYTFCHPRGKQVLEENLRQLCAWEQVEKEKSRWGVWFSYTGIVEGTTDIDSLEKASEEAHGEVGLDWGKTTECVKGLTSSAAKSRTDFFSIAGSTTLARIHVNDKQVPYGLLWDNIIPALCAGLQSEKPFYCDCEKNVLLCPKPGSGSLALIIAVSAFAVFAITCIVFGGYAMKRREKKKGSSVMQESGHELSRIEPSPHDNISLSTI